MFICDLYQSKMFQMFNRHSLLSIYAATCVTNDKVSYNYVFMSNCHLLMVTQTILSIIDVEILK